MEVKFLGHGCLEISVNNKYIIVDPFISGNPLNKTIDLNSLNPDYIFITHAHQDHVLDVEKIADKSKATIVSNFEITTYYEKLGYKVHPMNHGGKWEFDFGLAKYVNAIHTSSFANGEYGGNPGGFIIKSNNKCIYIAGDTALTYDMKLIPLEFSLDLAVLPIGDNFTMGVEDALIASDFIECNNILGYHYDTFGYIEINKEDAKIKFKARSKTLHLLEFGEMIKI